MIAPWPKMIEAGSKDDSVNIDFARQEFKRAARWVSAAARGLRNSKDRIDGVRPFPFPE